MALSIFHKGTLTDLSTAMTIIQFAQQQLAQQKISQWQNGYPNQAVLKKDIELGQLWIMKSGSEVVLTMSLVVGADPNYQAITGSWLQSSNKYLTIHRIAVAAGQGQHGFARQAFSFAEQLASKQGLQSIRIDTHADNKPMKHLINQLGYTECGQVRMPDNSLRTAFEKLV